jgi:membrane protein DedA with SNARE-associated domain
VNTLNQLIAEYGVLVYAIIFAWAFLEGETFVIFAGIAAHNGSLSLMAVFLCAWFGSFAGDQLYFWIGRRWGDRLLIKIPRWRPQVDMGLDFLRRYDTVFILSFRFLYGVRQVASFAIGMSRVAPARFAFLNFVAAGVWAGAFAGFGYFVGQVFGAFLGDLGQIFGLVMIGVLAGTLLVISRLNRRRARRTTEQLSVPVRSALPDVER